MKYKFKYAIASGHEGTTKVAQIILDAGGNAFDATVAAYLASFVTEPMMASAGAGGFINFSTALGEHQILDFFCQTPASKSGIVPNYTGINVDFGESSETFYCGPASMAVPGAIAMIHYLHKHYCRMPLRELIQPTLEILKSGISYSMFQALDTKLLANILQQSTRGKELFFNDGKTLAEGELFSMSQYADFLESFIREDAIWFYKGEIASSVDSYSRENGGYVRRSDFESYKIKIREPYRFDMMGRIVSAPDLPSMGGRMMQIFTDHLGDLVDKSLSQQHFSKLRSAFAQVIPMYGRPDLLDSTSAESNKIAGGTSHFNIVDRQGNAVSLSTSIGEGSGFFIPGTDMQMNNMLGEPGLMPNGIDTWKPDMRLNSMMTPIIVTDANRNLDFITGTGGSTRIPFSIAQVLINKYGFGYDLEKSTIAPRVFESVDKLYVEQGFDIDRDSIEKDINIWQENNLIFGGVHSIDVANGLAIGDSRREGSSVVVF